jgi:hypothetical protein
VVGTRAADAVDDRTAVLQPVDATITDQEIIGLMRHARRARAAGAPTVTCCIGGYDDDPRELGDIPEARELCKRLVRLGYIACLDIATSVREFPTFNHSITLGAWEVWRIARGEAKVGKSRVPAELLDEFITKELVYLSTVADDHLAGD